MKLESGSHKDSKENVCTKTMKKKSANMPMCQSNSFKNNLGDFQSESRSLRSTESVHKRALYGNVIIVKPSKYNEETNNGVMNALLYICTYLS